MEMGRCSLVTKLEVACICVVSLSFHRPVVSYRQRPAAEAVSGPLLAYQAGRLLGISISWRPF